MDRKEAAQIIADITIRRTRPDVPADVAEAVGVLMRVFNEVSDDRLVLAGNGPEAEVLRETIRKDRADAVAEYERSTT